MEKPSFAENTAESVLGERFRQTLLNCIDKGIGRHLELFERAEDEKLKKELRADMELAEISKSMLGEFDFSWMSNGVEAYAVRIIEDLSIFDSGSQKGVLEEDRFVSVIPNTEKIIDLLSRLKNLSSK